MLHSAVHSQMSQSLGSFGSSFASSNVQPYTSFPVDVVVYIRVQPSMVRFTCLPVSRVECLLRVPSLDIVFSTKKVDNYLAESAFSKKGCMMFWTFNLEAFISKYDQPIKMVCRSTNVAGSGRGTGRWLERVGVHE